MNNTHMTARQYYAHRRGQVAKEIIQMGNITSASNLGIHLMIVLSRINPKLCILPQPLSKRSAVNAVVNWHLTVNHLKAF